jgi:LysR family transcriptional regulator, glycine cleavage system transcriptional activator
MAQLPPLRAVQVFEAVGQTGSITGAARELGISAGAVSQQIKLLEQALGVRLLERRGKGVVLTLWGAAYHDGVAAALARLAKAGEELERLRSEAGLTISTLSSLATKWLGPALFDWRQQQGEIAIHLIGSEAEPRLGSDPVDFRVSYGHRIRQYQHSALLFTDQVVPVCAPALLGGAVLADPRDIVHYPLIGIDWMGEFLPPPGWPQWFATQGLPVGRVAPGMSFSLSSVAIDAAVSGRGFALGQLSMIAADLAAGRLIAPFDHRLPLPEPYFLAWDMAALDRPLGRALQSWLLTLGRQQGALALSPLADLCPPTC